MAETQKEELDLEEIKEEIVSIKEALHFPTNYEIFYMSS